MELDLYRLCRYELDVNREIAKADGPEDHKLTMEALAMLKVAHLYQPHQRTFLTGGVRNKNLIPLFRLNGTHLSAA